MTSLGESIAWASANFPGAPAELLRQQLDDHAEIVTRTFEVDIAEDGDGRTIEGLCVPYNVAARVADPPTFTPYDEMWMPGAFAGATKAPNRVLLDFEHRLSIGDVLGHGIEFTEQPDGLHGRFRVAQGSDGDKALALVRDKVLAGLSVYAKPLRSVRQQDGLVQRVRAHLDRVALCRTPAYEAAQVLAVRQAPPVEPEPMPDELAEKLTRVGFEPLIARAVVRRPWDGSAARFTDEEYQRSCLIDRGGDQPVKERCSLPVLEPNGDLNANALGAAAAALSGARTPLQGVTAAMKAAAARKLVRYYRMADMEPPAGMTMMARQ